MKKLLLWTVLMLMGVTLQFCTDEENPGLEKVQFTFSLSAPGNNGGRVEWNTLPASLLLSVQNSAGVPVFTLKEIELLHAGDNFITAPLEFTPGSYKVTDFMLVDEASTVLYAIPLSGSPLAKAVVHPLPYSFNVAKNKVTNVAMEVIDVSQQLPEDFGYTSFAVNAVNPLQVAVFTTTGTTTTLTTADAYVLHNNDTIKEAALAATINLISFSGAPQDDYQLIVVKPGYNLYIRDFVYADLIASLNNQPLKIFLVQSTFTMLAYTDGYGGPVNAFEFGFAATSGSFTVDWGDGTSSSSTSHEYAAPGNYLITVTGDLDQITDFYSFYGQGRMDAINVQGLTGLQDFRFGLTPRTPKVIDLTNNTKLDFVMVANLEQLEHLMLSPEAPIYIIDISGPSQLNTAAVDEIINTVYQSAVSHNTQGGHFLLYANWTDASTPMAPHPMIGPPSPAGMAQLLTLEGTYHWNVAPLLP